jgi:hypothetical protein
MAYEARHLRRQKIRYNNDNDDNPLLYQLIQDGVKITPSSATIQIFNSSGTSILSATATSLSISGTLMTYAPDTTTVATWPIDTGYRAHWIVTDSGSVTYESDQIFDVVNFVPFGWIGRDQLIALDDRVKGMEHDGDEDFSEVIEAVRDIIQLSIETKAVDDEQLLEDMILDHSRVAVVARFKVLAQLFREKGDAESAEYYDGEYSSTLEQMLAGIKYDTDQGLEEDEEQGRLTQVRLTT